jgi:putative transposase
LHRGGIAGPFLNFNYWNYFCVVNLTLKIKLLPSPDQAKSLLQTIKKANTACNAISKVAWSKKLFNQYKLHKETYYSIREEFDLSAQMVVRCISKVADGYKVDREVKRKFRPLGAITYDSRILSYLKEGISLWTVDGRLDFPFVCHNINYLPYIKGEADLVCKKRKFYIYQTDEVPEEVIKDAEDFIGCDFGQADICTLSDGTNFNSETLKKVRIKYGKVRASVQSKGTRGAKKLLRRLSGRERRFVSINNHYISKQIVQKAKAEGKGIAIEDLTKIRRTAKPKSKSQKTELNRWSFRQLRQYLTYKAKLSGIKLFAVPAAYTSQMCSDCLHIGKRVRKRFSCEHCGHMMDADHNAARNIATWGCLINQPEKPSILYCSVHRA